MVDRIYDLYNVLNDKNGTNNSSEALDAYKNLIEAIKQGPQEKKLALQFIAKFSQRDKISFYVGGRFLSQCEVSFLQETRINILNPWENLNDIIINPRFPCPCTLRQAQVDTRFGRLFSETQYENAQGIVCYAPRTTSWINVGQTFKLLKSQTCCYYWFSQGLITFGSLAGSVLSNPYILFLPYPWQRRIPFYDQCCSPSHITGRPDWKLCHFYYQLHPPSSCKEYQPPAIVTGVGDPHVNTIDDGRYTCHVQGLFVFAQTTTKAQTIAQNNFCSNALNIDSIYPDDLFQIYVRSIFVPPALSYIERTHDYGSIFSSYTIIAVRFTFVISNINGKFGFTVNNNSTFTNDLSNNLNYDHINTMNYSEQYIYRVQQTTRAVLNVTIPQLIISLWSGTSVTVTGTTESTTIVHLTSSDFQTGVMSTHISEVTSERSQTPLFISTSQSNFSPSTMVPTQSSTSISIPTEKLTSETSSSTTTTTATPQVCLWTSWVSLTNCIPNCGPAYRIVVRLCIVANTGQSCPTSLCGGGDSQRNETCSSSPPCETITVIPPTADRDPSIRIISYALPDTMYFFEQIYRRIWISNKGYITLNTPYYAQTMTNSAFRQNINQAIVAPFWADLSYISNYSQITINWLSSTNSTGSNASAYNNVIQSVIMSACPSIFCSLDFLAARVVQISWQNLVYELSSINKSIIISFSAYLINTYESDSSHYSYPILRSYIAFDYTSLPSDLEYLRPFVAQRDKRSFYVGGRFLSQCEVSFLQETRMNILYPLENLNDIIINPRFPCPCTLRQAQVDTRFGRLFSETQYENAQGIVCYAPRTTSWINVGSTFKLLKSQTCCYNWFSQGLITFGTLSGSVLSNPNIIFLPYPWQRRIPFYDQCCSPSYVTGRPDLELCHLYFQLHPSSSCSGYRPPSIVTGVGDPHVNTIDDGRYTCHIHGLFVFAQTTINAQTIAQNNLNNNLSNMDLIYPDDLFQIHVQSVFVPPALSYIERTHGYGSIFSSYTIIALRFTFVISFSVNDDSQLTADLSNNLNYDHINTMNYTEPYIYRLQQTTRSILNGTIPQLTISLWSGLSMEFEIIGENLECKLILPEKFRTHIEGLVGNFNGDSNDDLFNRETNQTAPIGNSSNLSASEHDRDVLNACLSYNRKPIMPRSLVEWYYKNASNFLTSLNSRLNQSIVNQTCQDNFECIHDYLIRINSFTSEATASGVRLIKESRTALAEIPPTIDLMLPIKIALPINNINRNYSFDINIIAGDRTPIKSAHVTIHPFNKTENINNTGLSSIIVPMPNNANSSVEVLLTIHYGSNSTVQTYLDILACLCTNGGKCSVEERTTISDHYQLASCDCLSQYDGILCELDYDGCTSGSACKVNWDNETTCIKLNAADQLTQNRSYYCNGTCIKGYNSSVNGYTCDDIDECSLNSSLCGNGTCFNLLGSYGCNCHSGYRFNNETCVDIDECTEPDINGTFVRRCSDGELCRNTDGNYSCECSSIFNNNGTCTYNSSLCNSITSTTCIESNGTILCINNTVKINGSCIAILDWCERTCHGFCGPVNNSYQCNCKISPGFEYSDTIKGCRPCRGPNYGYGCNESCRCVNGNCNRNATHENESCNCDLGYAPPFCIQLIDQCAINSPCNNATEDCATNPNNGTAICTCKLGYERNNVTGICTVCLWTSWVPLANCTSSCGPAYRKVVRLCIVASTGQSCPTSLCGRGESQRNESCSSSPPCETITIIPSTADRDPSIRIISFSLPNTLYFFEQTYRRIWIILVAFRINPRFPCPCTLRQAQVDTRFGRLFSKTQYENGQDIVCYARRTTNWINVGQTFKLLKSQTCCYYWFSQGLITFGSHAGSVLSNPYILFLPYSWQRRIPFYDQCCSPSHIIGRPDWELCYLYYQLHPPSSCKEYRPPAIVTGVGDPHVNTIDDGRYTYHIQGLFVFAQTTTKAQTIAQNNLHSNALNINLIYPDDLFQIYVRSIFVPPVLSYIERTHGYGSVFSSYTIIAVRFTFVISNNNGKFRNEYFKSIINKLIMCV
ncbi:unnamed protein product [Rotaria sp. Silwood2]|nr:unnamed protein product [Rotaria sp. Silwood2]